MYGVIDQQAFDALKQRVENVERAKSIVNMLPKKKGGGGASRVFYLNEDMRVGTPSRAFCRFFENSDEVTPLETNEEVIFNLKMFDDLKQDDCGICFQNHKEEWIAVAAPWIPPGTAGN